MKKNNQGLTLIESLTSIFVISFLITLFSSISYFLKLTLYSKNVIHAYEIAQEEIEALRNLTYDKLGDPTQPAVTYTGRFINVAFNLGDWQVKKIGIEPTTDYVYELAKNTVPLGDDSGRAIIPGGDYENFTIQVDINVLSDSPIGWSSGFYFRYVDSQNHYRFMYDKDKIYIDRFLNGIKTEIIPNGYSLPFNTDTTYTLKISADDNNFKFYRNGAQYAPATTYSDNVVSFIPKGKIVLFGKNSVHSQFDDVVLKIPPDTETTTLFSEDYTDLELNKVAEGWQRFGINDLPGGLDTLTIRSYGDPNSSDYGNIKEIISKVTWKEDGRDKELILNTLISSYGIHP